MERPNPAVEALWHSGANYAADAVVVSDQDSLLLIQRHCGKWALPGGFVDEGEDSSQAARRELVEETGLKLESPGQLIYSGKVADPRNSSDRWIASDAYLFSATEVDVHGQDDAIEARWWPVDQLPPQLYGSHSDILERALLHRQRRKFYQLLLEAARGSGV